MFRRSISEVLLAHRDSHQAVEAFLTTGHDFCVDVRAVGDQWFSGEVSGADPCGVVIGFRAIAAIELNTALVNFPPPGAPPPSPSLTQMLDSLARLSKTVVLYTSGSHWVGRLREVGHDYVELVSPHGKSSFYLQSSLQWIRVTG